MMGAAFADVYALQSLVQNFALRDRGDWDGLRALFVPGARIQVSWYDGPIEGFIEASKRMAAAGGASAKHQIWSPRLRVAGARAIGDVDIAICVRLALAGGEVDVTSWARFHDCFERTADGWRIAERRTVYEKDRLDPVGGTRLGEAWAPAALAGYPAAYKHLAKVMELVGRKLPGACVCVGTEEETGVFAAQAVWLGGAR
jgi:hypothetical protein